MCYQSLAHQQKWHAQCGSATSAGGLGLAPSRSPCRSGQPAAAMGVRHGGCRGLQAAPPSMWAARHQGALGGWRGLIGRDRQRRRARRRDRSSAHPAVQRGAPRDPAGGRRCVRRARSLGGDRFPRLSRAGTARCACPGRFATVLTDWPARVQRLARPLRRQHHIAVPILHRAVAHRRFVLRHRSRRNPEKARFAASSGAQRRAPLASVESASLPPMQPILQGVQ